MKPSRARRKPGLDRFYPVLRNDMTQRQSDRLGKAGIEECITPEESPLMDAIHDPPHHPPPLPRRHQVVLRVGSREVTPAEIARVPLDEKTVCALHSREERIELFSCLAQQLEGVALQPPLELRE